MSADVTTPDGQQWRVQTRALLWRPRRRVRFELDPIGVLLGVVGVPLLALEWVVAATLSLLAAGVRTALRRPWRVEATAGGPTTKRLTWEVRGWRAARQKADELRAEIAAGQDPSRHADRRQISQGG